jgi:hypothetical protein
LTKYNFIFVGVFFVLAILNTNNKLYYKMESHTRGQDGKVVKSETNYLLKLFNSPQELCSILSNNEIGKLSEWKALNAGTNLFSSSSSFQIDSQENEDSIKNIISYLILGNKNLVKELNIIMDINNEKQRNYGLNFLISITEKTLISLNLDLDKSIKNDISNAIKSPRKFKFENESFVIYIDNRWDKTRNNIKIENYYNVKIFIRDKPPLVFENLETNLMFLNPFTMPESVRSRLRVGKHRVVALYLSIIYNISYNIVQNGISHLKVSSVI